MRFDTLAPMADGRRSRRRRRGGSRPQADGQPPRQESGAESAAAPGSGEAKAARPPRVDRRRSAGGEGPPGPSQGRTQRSPGAADRPRSDGRGRDGRGREGRSGGEGRSPRESRPPRTFEPPTPQDERSVELGAAFKEAQIAAREARKALEKRRAEFGDEPEWMLQQLEEAERRFEEAATAWSDHLATTGRKVVRR